MQGDVGPAQAPGRVDPGRQPEPDGGCVDGGGVDAGHAHQRAEPGLLGAREAPEADGRECAVLVDERDDIGDRGERDEIGMAGELGWSAPRSACASLTTTPVPQRSGKG